MSCIVVFRHPDRIILASDSLVTSAAEDATALSRFTDANGKITTHGPWALTFSGFSRGPNGMDVREALGREIQGTRTMVEAVNAVQRVFIRKLYPNLALARNYPMFRDLFIGTTGGAVLAVLMAGKNPDGTLVVGSFGADIPDQQSFQAQMYGGTCPGVMGDGSRPFYFCVGQDPTASLVLKQPRPEWLAKGDPAAARRLLEMQTEATPDCVGPPYHVLEITKDGMERRVA